MRKTRKKHGNFFFIFYFFLCMLPSLSSQHINLIDSGDRSLRRILSL
ncbi:hypothetical protein LEMLEM_LOCUS18937 [Lemmus lemmus]